MEEATCGDRYCGDKITAASTGDSEERCLTIQPKSIGY